MFLKKKRVESREVLDAVKAMPCAICGKTKGIDPHHLKSRGAGGDDSFSNCVPLCRQHHTEIHTIGLTKMTEKYSTFKKWLLKPTGS